MKSDGVECFYKKCFGKQMSINKYVKVLEKYSSASKFSIIQIASVISNLFLKPIPTS